MAVHACGRKAITRGAPVIRVTPARCLIPGVLVQPGNEVVDSCVPGIAGHKAVHLAMTCRSSIPEE